MSLIWAGSTSATKALDLFGTVVGAVTADTSVQIYNEDTVKCDSAAGAAAHIRWKSDFTLSAGRASVRYTGDLPDSDTGIMHLMSASAVLMLSVSLDSSGAFRLRAGSLGATVVAGPSAGGVVSADTPFRLTACWNIRSTTDWDLSLYINDDASPLLSVTGETTSLNNTQVAIIRSGYMTAVGAGLVLNFAHPVVDDDSSLAAWLPGDASLSDRGPRVTSKQPGTAATSDAAWSNLGTGAVDERPLNAANGRQLTNNTETGTQTYNVISASAGDLDISTATIHGYIGWMFASKSNNLGTPTDQLVLGGAANSTMAVATTASIFWSPAVTGSSYPTVIGWQRTVGGNANAEFLDAGVLVVYTPPAGAVEKIGTDSLTVVVTDAAFLSALASAAESVGVRASEAPALLASASATEAFRASLSEAGYPSAVVSASESAAVQAAESAATSVLVPASESIAVVGTEASGLRAELPASDAEALGISEDEALSASPSAAESVSVAVGESAALLARLDVTEGAGVGVAEAASVVSAFVARDDVRVALSEAHALLVQVDVADAAAVGASDLAALLASVTVTDATALSAVETTNLLVSLSVADALRAAATEVGVVVVALTSTEALAVLTSEAASLRGEVPARESLAVALDDRVGALTALVSAAEALGLSLSETASLLATLAAADSPSVIVTETGSVTVSGEGMVAVTASDTVSVTIADAVALSALLTAAELTGLGLSEDVAVYASVDAYADALGVTVEEAVALLDARTATDEIALIMVESGEPEEIEPEEERPGTTPARQLGWRLGHDVRPTRYRIGPRRIW